VGQAEALTRSLVGAANLLPLDARSIELTLELSKNSGLRFFDAAMLATILLDLDQHPTAQGAWFVSRDSAFADASVKALLAARGCKWVHSFRSVAEFLGSSSPP
jgi:hypothetical protein